MVGGQAPKAIRSVECYDFEEGRWDQIAELPSRRCRAGTSPGQPRFTWAPCSPSPAGVCPMMAVPHDGCEALVLISADPTPHPPLLAGTAVLLALRSVIMNS